MGQAIGNSLPAAIGIALSPIAIIGLILILFTKRARINSLAFTAGWLAGLTFVALTVIALVNAGRITLGSEATDRDAPVLSLLLGVALIFLAWRAWRMRPKVGEQTGTPKWMKTIDSIKPGAAFALGALMSGPGPKNLLLNIAGALAIALAPLTTGQTAVALIIYLLIASASILGLVIYYQVAGSSAEIKLNELKDWLIQNNTAVTAVLLLVIGVKLIGNFLSAVF